MTAPQLNAFLRLVASDPPLQQQLRACDAGDAARLAREHGFDVCVGDLTRYKARATSWQLSDAELEVVAEWQPPHQPYWWQLIWPIAT